MLDPFGGQRLALTAKPAAVFIFRRRRPYHGADARFAAFVCQQRANQSLAVDPVGLGPPPPAGGRNRGRIDNVAFDLFALQHTVNPEAIQSRLLNDDDREGFSRPRERLLLELRKARQQRTDVSGGYAVLRHLLAAARRQRGDQPSRTTELQ